MIIGIRGTTSTRLALSLIKWTIQAHQRRAGTGPPASRKPAPMRLNLQATTRVTEVGKLMPKCVIALIVALLFTVPIAPVRTQAHEGHDHGTFSAGQPGDSNKPARTIRVLMHD